MCAHSYSKWLSNSSHINHYFYQQYADGTRATERKTRNMYPLFIEKATKPTIRSSQKHSYTIRLSQKHTPTLSGWAKNTLVNYQAELNTNTQTIRLSQIHTRKLSGWAKNTREPSGWAKSTGEPSDWAKFILNNCQAQSHMYSKMVRLCRYTLTHSCIAFAL